MATVKIISGVYGYVPEGSNYVIPVGIGDPAISVDDEEAKRLVDIGVAAYVDAAAVATALPGDSSDEAISNSHEDEGGENGDPAPGEITGNLDPDSLNDWKMDELKKLAADMGIDTTGIKKKGDLIQAITAVEVSVPSDAPVLDVEDVIE